MMSLAWHQFRLERRMFWRNPTAAFFNFLLPLLLLSLFGAVFAGQQQDLDVIVPGIAGVSVMSATFIALAYNLTFLREHGVLKRLRGTPLPAGAYLAGIAASCSTTFVTALAATPPRYEPVGSGVPRSRLSTPCSRRNVRL